MQFPPQLISDKPIHSFTQNINSIVALSAVTLRSYFGVRQRHSC